MRHRVVRHGSAYVMILMISLIVALMGYSVLSLERLRSRAIDMEADWTDAQVLAQSGIDHALRTIEAMQAASPNWRSSLRSSTVTRDAGDGQFSWKLCSLSGDLISTSVNNPLVVRAHGRMNNAEHAVEVVLQPSGPGIPAIKTSLQVGGDSAFDQGSLLVSDTAVHINGEVRSQGAMVFPNVLAGDGVLGETYLGVIQPSVDATELPSSAIVFDYYLRQGTWIDVESVPWIGSKPYIEEVVISPGSNPFGSATNPEGIYILDCKSRNVVIRNVRVHGTLVLLRPGSSSEITGAVHWTPAAANLATLLVDGSMTLGLATAHLSEDAIGVNFNPADSPFGGEHDEDLEDNYVSIIKGVVYVSDNLDIGGLRTAVEGAIVVDGDLALQSQALLEITWVPSLYTDAPIGFVDSDGTVRIAPFTWRQYVQ